MEHVLKSVVRAHNEYELAWTAWLGLKDDREGGREATTALVAVGPKGRRNRDGTGKEGTRKDQSLRDTQKSLRWDGCEVARSRGSGDGDGKWMRTSERGRQGRHANFCIS